MKTAVLIAFLFASLLLQPHITSAQSGTEPSVCEYKGKWENPETLQRPSITKDKIRRCLQAKITIANHYIAFEDYRDAWQELAKETGDYAIPLLLRGGVLHANIPYDDAGTRWHEDDTGGIRLGEFRDPTVKDASQLTEKERKTFGIEKTDELIGHIRSRIEWEGVLIDSAVSVVIVKSEGMYSNGNTPIIIFRNITNFITSNFSGKTDFTGSIFSGNTDFSESTFSNMVSFGRSIFSGDTHFRESIFSNDADFTGSTFIGDTYFGESIFRKVTSFSRSTFSKTAFFSPSAFSKETDFSGATFSGNTNFSGATFSGNTNFSGATFRKETDFSWSTFSKEAIFSESAFSKEAIFSGSTFERSIYNGVQFRDNADFRYMIVTETLEFNDNTYHKRLDLRSMSAKAFQWNSTNSPSNVQGVVDMREANIGSAIVKEVRFQDLVDFSRMTFGQYKIIEENYNIKVESHPSPLVLIENNTFENEADFLHVKFNAPTVFINNRFRSTLDLTGAKFETQNPQAQNSHLCLSFNRINRLIFEPEHLGNPPGIYPHQQFMSLFAQPLQTSRVRRIDDTECILPEQTSNNPENTPQDEEPLDDIYKTLGKSFREANDRAGINEAWYLQTLAERNDSNIGGQLAWIFLNIPSRYSVDVWRVVWLSVAIMFCFYVLYLIEHIIFGGIGRLWRWLRSKPRLESREVNILGHPDRHRAFRLRIFEPIHRRIAGETQRKYVPWRDAATLSVRSFLKIGLGTVYPDTRLLKFLTTIEWLLGAYMLIHFILAVKNNLPFILPFLGAVN